MHPNPVTNSSYPVKVKIELMEPSTLKQRTIRV